MAGIIAARAGTIPGLAGVAPGAIVCPVKAFDRGGRWQVWYRITAGASRAKLPTSKASRSWKRCRARVMRAASQLLGAGIVDQVGAALPG